MSREPLLESLISKLQSNPAIEETDLQQIYLAYDIACKAHAGQFRKSGDNYMIHPLSVANILAEMELDPATIIAGLLHDTVEDSDLTTLEIEKTFGKPIAYLVESVSKLGKLSFASREELQAENFRKMLLAMASDIRVIIIKMADRLHNMQTLEYLSPEQQHDISQETRDIYAPLAHRLGMGKIKWELEDLAFRYLESEQFEKIKSLIAEKRKEREEFLAEFRLKIEEMLTNSGISASISGRPKHFYSIYRKMMSQNLDFSDIYDLLAIRIIIQEISECYSIIGLIHSKYRPVPGKFKDYIAMPKGNMYQSLHTTILSKEGRPVEIQIRTEEMHKINEDGVAAHWKYKEGKTDFSKKTADYEEKLVWLRQLIEWQHDLSDSKEFMDSLKLDLFVDSVFVFTPKGDVHELQTTATPLDFAYHIHTEVGHRCNGAKVNGQIVPLSYRLKNGDIVEILTSKTDHPRRDWLDFVVSRQAKSRIKAWLKKHDLAEQDEPEPKTTIQPAKKELKNQHTKTTKKDKEYNDIQIPGASNLLTHIAKCCHPIPGDDIIGHITKIHGISIHRVSCPNNNPECRVVTAQWDLTTKGIYEATFEIEARDRVGLFSDIMGQISATNTNIKEANVQTIKGKSSVVAKVTVDVKSVNDLKLLFNNLHTIKSVYAVYRT